MGLIHWMTNSQVYKKFRDSIPDPIIDKDVEFQELFKEVRPYTLGSKYKLFALYQSISYVLNNEISGDFVECGVWRGGCPMLMGLMCQKYNVSRKVWLFDTFAGMPRPDEKDYMITSVSQSAQSIWNKQSINSNSSKWCLAPEEEVRDNLLKVGLDISQFIFVKGLVENTIPCEGLNEISVLRLDTDWYSSTKHELLHLFPIVVNGGIVIIDDYGSWAGSKKAVDEFMTAEPGILLNRIDRSGYIIKK